MRTQVNGIYPCGKGSGRPQGQSGAHRVRCSTCTTGNPRVALILAGRVLGRHRTNALGPKDLHTRAGVRTLVGGGVPGVPGAGR
jgi:hypothetical protein